MDLLSGARRSGEKTKSLTSRFPRFWKREGDQENSGEDSVAVRILGLFSECDRVDAMPADDERDQAMVNLLDQVRRFEEEVQVSEKDAGFLEVMKRN